MNTAYHTGIDEEGILFPSHHKIIKAVTLITSTGSIKRGWVLPKGEVYYIKDNEFKKPIVDTVVYDDGLLLAKMIRDIKTYEFL